jgi:hypothetical protein
MSEIIANIATIGSANTSANGSGTLTNQLELRWGSVQANSSVGDITFETPFSSLFSITITPETSTVDSTYQPQLIASNTTTANVRTSNTTSITVYYNAFGI